MGMVEGRNARRLIVNKSLNTRDLQPWDWWKNGGGRPHSFSGRSRVCKKPQTRESYNMIIRMENKHFEKGKARKKAAS